MVIIVTTRSIDLRRSDLNLLLVLFWGESANAVPTTRNCSPEFLTLEGIAGVSLNRLCNGRASARGDRLIDHGTP